jgi:hypothetical protein
VGSYKGTPTADDLMRAVRRQALDSIRRISDKNKKPKASAADEMWLLGGPENTSQGGFALALMDDLKRRMYG